MIDMSCVLSNATVTIERQGVTSDARGSITKVYTPVYTDIPARIEDERVENPVTFAGHTLTHWYQLSVWKTANCDVTQICDGDRVTDTNTGKQYIILDMQIGGVFKDRGHKMEAVMIVLNDDRYANFDEPK